MSVDGSGRGATSCTCAQVYKGLWRGITVAVKTMMLPVHMSGAEKREKMAVMEAAISSSLSHPNIVQASPYPCLLHAFRADSVARRNAGAPRAPHPAHRWGRPACSQTYTYTIKPVKDSSGDAAAAADATLATKQSGELIQAGAGNNASTFMSMRSNNTSFTTQAAVHSYEVRAPAARLCKGGQSRGPSLLGWCGVRSQPCGQGSGCARAALAHGWCGEGSSPTWALSVVERECALPAV